MDVDVGANVKEPGDQQAGQNHERHYGHYTHILPGPVDQKERKRDAKQQGCIGGKQALATDGNGN